MRCPDCGYLLLDAKAHCPKCEKTLQEQRAAAAKAASVAEPAKPRRTKSKQPPADEISRSYPSLRLNGVGLSGAAALALSDDDSSDPNLQAEEGSAGEISAELRVVPQPDPLPEEMPAGEISAVTSIQKSVQEDATDARLLAEALAEEIAGEEMPDEQFLTHEEAEAPAAAEEELITDETGSGNIALAQDEISAETSAAEISQPVPLGEDTLTGRVTSEDDEHIAAREEEERAVIAASAALEEEAAREDLIDGEVTGSDAEEESGEQSLSGSDVTWEHDDDDLATAQPEAPSPAVIDLPEPVLEAPSIPLAASAATVEQSVAEISLNLTGKLKAPAVAQSVAIPALPEAEEPEDVTDSIFNTMVQVPQNQPMRVKQEPVSKVPPRPAPAVAPVSSPLRPRPSPYTDESIGARTGEIPPPAAYARVNLPVQDEDSGNFDDLLEEDLNATRISARPTVAAAQGAPASRAQQAAPVAADEEPSLQTLLSQRLNPTQISFPHISPAQATWPTMDPAAGEQSGEFPTAEVIGEASSRFSVSQRGAIGSFKGKALGRRMLAFLFDYALTCVLAFAFVAAANFMVGAPVPLVGKGELALSNWEVLGTIFVLRLVLDACYQIGYLATTGRTPGLGLMGLKVYSDEGATQPAFAQAALRWAWAYLLTLGISWGAFAARKDPQGRALHDQKAHTRILLAA